MLISHTYYIFVYFTQTTRYIEHFVPFPEVIILYESVIKYFV